MIIKYYYYYYIKKYNIFYLSNKEILIGIRKSKYIKY